MTNIMYFNAQIINKYVFTMLFLYDSNNSCVIQFYLLVYNDCKLNTAIIDK